MPALQEGESRAFIPAALPSASGPARVHLQWFAAEDEGRTEEPTEYRLKKAREEGRVVKSQELVGAIGLLLPMLTLVIAAPSMLGTLQDMVTFYFQRAFTLDPISEPGILVTAFFRYFLSLVAPVVAVALVSGIASNLVQVGFLFTVKPITPDFSKIVPRFGKYFQRTLFSPEGAFNLVKSIVKVAIVAVIAYLNIYGAFPKLMNLYIAPMWYSIKYISDLAVRIIIESAVVMLALAIPDYLFQRWQFMESLKMTKQEIKEEHKMYEGDPLIKGRLREKMRELLGSNIARTVPKASVVITNPTHYAIALQFEMGAMVAPMVTAKGVDETALRIRSIAFENDVPIVENRPLARALYAEIDIGDIIPEKYYQAIVNIFAHLEKMKSQAPGRSAGIAENAV
jgi:flagellar biosynthetic protein FlhB